MKDQLPWNLLGAWGPGDLGTGEAEGEEAQGAWGGAGMPRTGRCGGVTAGVQGGDPPPAAQPRRPSCGSFWGMMVAAATLPPVAAPLRLRLRTLTPELLVPTLGGGCHYHGTVNGVKAKVTGLGVGPSMDPKSVATSCCDGHSLVGGPGGSSPHCAHPLPMTWCHFP